MWNPLDILFPPRVDERVVRDLSFEEFLSIVSPNLMSETRPETVTLLTFSHPKVRATLHEAKYHGNDRALSCLGAAIADFLPDYVADLPFNGLHKSIIIVPIPLGKVRQKERGFNQVEEIVQYAMKTLGPEFAIDTKLLIRVRETATQVALPREEREKNMINAFKTTYVPDPKHLYILIDDVVTTGATLQSAISAMHSAGVIHILPIALAH